MRMRSSLPFLSVLVLLNACAEGGTSSDGGLSPEDGGEADSGDGGGRDSAVDTGTDIGAGGDPSIQLLMFRSSYALAIFPDGSVVNWGPEPGLTLIREWLDDSRPSQIRSGVGGLCGITPTGDLSCIGLFESGLVEQVEHDVREYRPASGGRLCVLDRDGRIRCYEGQNEPVFADPPEESFEGLVGDYTYMCGIRGDQTISCFGEAGIEPRLPPPEEPLREVHVGQSTACGLGMEGEIRCWISDIGGSLSEVPDGRFDHLAFDGQMGCVWDDGEKPVCWGSLDPTLPDDEDWSRFDYFVVDTGRVAGVTLEGKIRLWGNPPFLEPIQPPPELRDDG